jgi:hypothetical protein
MMFPIYEYSSSTARGDTQGKQIGVAPALLHNEDSRPPGNGAVDTPKPWVFDNQGANQHQNPAL